jgi:hypothetical protein
MPIGFENRLEHGAAATDCAAMTGELRFRCGIILFFARQTVIVGEFLARTDRAQGFNVYPPRFDHWLAIGFARMVDEARLIAIHAGINDSALVHDEQQDVRVRAFVFVARIRLLMRNALTGIFDEARTFGNPLRGEDAKALDGGGADFKKWLGLNVESFPGEATAPS